jgi:hypothetical protein
LSEELLSLVRNIAKDKDADDLLLTSSSGGRLHAAGFKRTTRWATTGRGRRLHDLAHGGLRSTCTTSATAPIKPV